MSSTKCKNDYVMKKQWRNRKRYFTPLWEILYVFFPTKKKSNDIFYFCTWHPNWIELICGLPRLLTLVKFLFSCFSNGDLHVDYFSDSHKQKINQETCNFVERKNDREPKCGSISKNLWIPSSKKIHIFKNKEDHQLFHRQTRWRRLCYCL